MLDKNREKNYHRDSLRQGQKLKEEGKIPQKGRVDEYEHMRMT